MREIMNFGIERTTRFAALAAVAAGMLLPATDSRAEGLTGKVTFKGPRPEREAIEMIDVKSPMGRQAKSDCVKLHGEEGLLKEDAIVSEKGEVANVFVYVTDPPDGEWPMPEKPAVLNQVGCAYTPHVQGMRAGQTLEIHNSDPTLHNVRSYSQRNPPFNLGQPNKGDVREKLMRRPEKEIRFGCDVHKWMRGFIFVMDHPFYAVTGEDGTFSIAGLPAGTYTLAAWHEEFGEIKKEISVKEGEAPAVDFTFEPKE